MDPSERKRDNLDGSTSVLRDMIIATSRLRTTSHYMHACTAENFYVHLAFVGNTSLYSDIY